jgi:hypothetical protein
MTLLEFFGTTAGTAVTGVLGKIGLEWARRRPSFRPVPNPSPVVVDLPRRSYSPSSFAAALDEKATARESLREQGEQTALLRQVVVGLEKVGEQTPLLRQVVTGLDKVGVGLEKVADKTVATARVLHEDMKTTRHEIHDDLKALHAEIAMALGNDPPRVRHPTNPTIEPRRRDPR